MRKPGFGNLRRKTLRFALAATCALTSGAAIAQTTTPWPSRPVRIVVNFPAGGPLDILARLVAGSLSSRLGQAFAVENITGAAGEIGASTVARAQPDGHTVLISIDAPFTIARAMRPQGGARIDDFSWVALMGTSGLTVAAHPSAGVRTLAELIERGRGRAMNFSTAGPGSPGHLAAAVLAEAAGVQATPVHYRGNSPAVLAVVSGEVDAAIISTPGLLPHIRSGKVQALAVASSQRSALLPETPTVAEAGYPALAQESLYLVALPARAPEGIVRALAGAIAEVLSDAGARERLVALDLTPGTQDGVAARVHLSQTLERYTRIVKATGMKADP